MFLIINKRIIISIILIITIICALSFPALPVSANIGGYKIVIDAGHGGRDGGAQSKNGVKESNINLSIAMALGKELEARGINVAYTRTTTDGLYDAFAKNKKKSDMDARRKIIEKENPLLVVSIHLNTFPNASVKGAQTFYTKGAEISEKFANSVQAQLNKELNQNKTAKTGDYYILDSTAYPAILVECGFLTNPEDEKLLQTKEHQNKLAYLIAVGIVSQIETVVTSA